MYLSTLSEDNKRLFLNLEIYLSKVDSDFSEEEKVIIDTHCAEMHIDNNNYEVDMPRDEIFKHLKESLTNQESRIVFLELVGTIMADNVYHTEEEKLIKSLAKIIGIKDDDISEAFCIISEMKNVYKRCREFVERG